jgi:hypothetical protein
LQRCDEESTKVGAHGLKGSVVLRKTALFEKGLPLSSFLRVAREFVGQVWQNTTALKL